MPIYGFECDACGHRFDRLQKLSDADPTTCPDCGAQALRRQLTAPAFRLSGSGWYETDFKKDGDRKRNLVDKADGAGSGDKGEGKAGAASPPDLKPASSDSKPAASAASAETSGSKAAPKPETKPAPPPAST